MIFGDDDDEDDEDDDDDDDDDDDADDDDDDDDDDGDYHKHITTANINDINKCGNSGATSSSSINWSPVQSWYYQKLAWKIQQCRLATLTDVRNIPLLDQNMCASKSRRLGTRTPGAFL